MIEISYNKNKKQQIKMPDYQEGKIYKIYNAITDDIYIGSTTQKLCERMRTHGNAQNPKKHSNYLIYQAFREHGVNNFYIELIEKHPCNDRDELRKKEGEYIRKLKPSLNRRIAGRTDKEYYNDNRDVLVQKSREYAAQNREKVLQNHRDYYQRTKDSDSRIEYITKYNADHREEKREYDKQYREENRESSFHLKQQYRETNKERISAYKADKIKCDCGCMIARVNLAQHRRTKKHEQHLPNHRIII